MYYTDEYFDMADRLSKYYPESRLQRPKRQKPDYLRSVFFIKITDTHIYRKEEVIEHLKTVTNVSGIGIKVLEVENDICIIESRSNSLRYAVMDFNHLHNYFNMAFGEVEEEYFIGRHYKRNKAYWLPYTVIEVMGWKQ